MDIIKTRKQTSFKRFDRKRTEEEKVRTQTFKVLRSLKYGDS